MITNANIKRTVIAMMSLAFACGGQQMGDSPVGAGGQAGGSVGGTGGTGGTTSDAQPSAGAGGLGSGGVQAGGAAGSGGVQAGGTAGSGGVQVGGAAGSGGVQAGGAAGSGGEIASSGGAAGAGGTIACPGPALSTNCAAVPNFQCGFDAQCEGKKIIVRWHVHVPCGARDNIESYLCSYDCPVGCVDTGGWPPSGTALIAEMCTGSSLDGGADGATTDAADGGDER